jgi:hypothetical protein
MFVSALMSGLSFSQRIAVSPTKYVVENYTNIQSLQQNTVKPV